jgi:cytochrome c5
LIKTPKQLVTVVVLSFIVPIALILLTINVITGGIDVDPDSPAMSDEAVAKRLNPGSEAPKKAGGGAAASVAVANANPGESLYNKVCQTCHNAGIGGAPKFGDKAAWGERLKQGKETLYKSVINGKNLMPARGGAAGATDDDIKASVDYILSKVQ